MSLINDALKRARQAQQRPSISPSVEGSFTVPPPLQPVENTGRETPQRLLVVIPVLLLSLGISVWLLWKWKNPEAKAAASRAPSELTEVQATHPAKTNALAIAAATMTKWQARQELVGLETPAELKASAQADAKKTPVRQREASVMNESPKVMNTSLAGSVSDGSVSAGVPVAVRPPGLAPTAEKAPALANATSAGNVVSSGTTPSVTPPAASASATFATYTSAQASPRLLATEPMPEPKLQGIFYRLKRPTALIDGRIVSLGDDINGCRVIRIERDTVKLTAAGRTNTLTLH